MSSFNAEHIIGYAVMNDNYKFIYADPAFYEFLGVPKVSIFTGFIHNEDRQRFIDSIKETNETGLSTYTGLRLRDNDGIYTSAMIVAEPGDKQANGEPTYRLTAYDIINLLESCRRLDTAFKKVSYALQMTNPVITFDLDFKNNSVKIFNDRQHIAYTGDPETWSEGLVTRGYIDPNQVATLRKLMADIKRGVPDAGYSLRVKLNPEDKEYLPVTMCSTVMYDKNGNVDAIVGIVMRDAVGTGTAVASSNVDPLTGLFNKTAIRIVAENAIANKEPITLIIVDLDHFKQVNDTFGHMQGDKVIATAARVIKETVGTKGYVGRIGGDEFLIVLKGVNHDPDELRPILRALKIQISWAFRNKLEDTNLTASIGCSCYPEDSECYEDLFKLADYCLYVAKTKGRNRYVFYNERYHGSLKAIKGGGDTIVAKSCYSDEQRLDFVYDAVEKLSCEGKDAIAWITKEFCNYFDADEFHVYRTSDWLHAAKPMGDTPSLSCCWDELAPYFTSHNMLHCQNIALLEKDYPKLYSLMAEGDIKSFFIYTFKKDGAITHVAAVYNNDGRYKWSPVAVKLAAVVLRAIGDKSLSAIAEKAL